MPVVDETRVLRTDVSCSKCGYNLRGLESSACCPECDQLVADTLSPPVAVFPPAQIRWARFVGIGLILLVIGSFASLGVTLNMYFSNEFGGTVPRVNYLGPKVPAVQLLQRAAGYAPGYLGVNGVTAGLMIACAIILITTSPTERNWHEPLWSLRFWARWTPLVLFGGFLGLIFGCEGIDTSDPQLRKFSVAAIMGVEAPATILLYVFLRQLSRELGLLNAARTFAICSMLIGLLMIAAATMVVLGQHLAYDRNDLPLQIAVSVYMAVSLCTAAAALGAVIRLLSELAPIGLRWIAPKQASR